MSVHINVGIFSRVGIELNCSICIFINFTTYKNTTDQKFCFMDVKVNILMTLHVRNCLIRKLAHLILLQPSICTE